MQAFEPLSTFRGPFLGLFGGLFLVYFNSKAVPTMAPKNGSEKVEHPMRSYTLGGHLQKVAQQRFAVTLLPLEDGS